MTIKTEPHASLKKNIIPSLRKIGHRYRYTAKMHPEFQRHCFRPKFEYKCPNFQLQELFQINPALPLFYKTSRHNIVLSFQNICNKAPWKNNPQIYIRHAETKQSVILAFTFPSHSILTFSAKRIFNRKEGVLYITTHIYVAHAI